MGKRDEYRKKTQQTGEAPSGTMFRWRGLSVLELTRATECLPALADGTKMTDLSGSDLEALEKHYRNTVVLGTLEPRITHQPDSDPDSIPVEELGPDLQFLYDRIMIASNLKGPRAAEAATFRDGQTINGQAAPHGEGISEDAVGVGPVGPT